MSTIPATLRAPDNSALARVARRFEAQALSALPGITEVKADHKAATVIICSEGPVDEAIVAATIKEAGYDYKGLC